MANVNRFSMIGFSKREEKKTNLRRKKTKRTETCTKKRRKTDICVKKEETRSHNDNSQTKNISVQPSEHQIFEANLI